MWTRIQGPGVSAEGTLTTLTVVDMVGVSRMRFEGSRNVPLYGREDVGRRHKAVEVLDDGGFATRWMFLLPVGRGKQRTLRTKERDLEQLRPHGSMGKGKPEVNKEMLLCILRFCPNN